VPYRDPLT